MLPTKEQIFEKLNQLAAEEIDLQEARFKRVVRSGKIVKKFRVRKGFKILI